jgi:hypothetical protein
MLSQLTLPADRFARLFAGVSVDHCGDRTRGSVEVRGGGTADPQCAHRCAASRPESPPSHGAILIHLSLTVIVHDLQCHVGFVSQTQMHIVIGTEVVTLIWLASSSLRPS